ncbi:T9SS type A sorting domain-containing protein [Bacteroidales bacterium OttesenSCG-928-B11]|nr:T9SS type A sorting domain-containing protein [Bacteroidales bacterium OttesenSCG-928-C03]MDL2312228.1 T9SS type A sorting domain-containing protein [Bacteroidales bacterium OttesenSCG-928-B11]
MKKQLSSILLFVVIALSANAQQLRSNIPNRPDLVANTSKSDIPEDVTIPAEDILYWLGEGSHEMIFIVNWCSPEVALAWGYRFSEDSVTLETIMDDIMENDPRFSYEAGAGYVEDILFQDSTHNLSLSTASNYFMFLINGAVAQLGYVDQLVTDGDYIKWGENSCAHIDEEYNMSWTTEITPVSIPAGVGVGSFDNISFSISPNPAVDYVCISYIGNRENNTISIIDLSGRIVRQETMNDNNAIISTDELKNGIYFVRIANGISSKVEKLIIAR